MRWSLPVLVAGLAALLISCGGVGLAREEPLVEDIGLVACDVDEQLAVTDFRPGGGGRLVPATVFAVGWDASHIIAKRHPAEGLRVDKSLTEYFIVVVSERKGYGPFDAQEFGVRRDSLNVSPYLAFTRVYRDLE
jgi:hypothetical protein